MVIDGFILFEQWMYTFNFLVQCIRIVLPRVDKWKPVQTYIVKRMWANFRPPNVFDT